MADSPFLKALGTPTIRTAPAQTGELAQRAVEEWERNVFFSSDLADHALRLGPYMRRSCK